MLLTLLLWVSLMGAKGFADVDCEISSVDYDYRQVRYRLYARKRESITVIPYPGDIFNPPAKHFWIMTDSLGNPGYILRETHFPMSRCGNTSPLRKRDVLSLGYNNSDTIRSWFPRTEDFSTVFDTSRQLRRIQLVVLSDARSVEEYLDGGQLAQWPNIDRGLWEELRRWRPFAAVCQEIVVRGSARRDSLFGTACASQGCRDSMRLSFQTILHPKPDPQFWQAARAFLDLYSHRDSTGSYWRWIHPWTVGMKRDSSGRRMEPSQGDVLSNLSGFHNRFLNTIGRLP
jgi:hypothetical protein